MGGRGQEGAGCFWELVGGHRGLRGQRGGLGRGACWAWFCPGDSRRPSAFRVTDDMIGSQFSMKLPLQRGKWRPAGGQEQEESSGALAAFQEGGGGVWSTEAAGRVCGAAGPGAGRVHL